MSKTLAISAKPNQHQTDIGQPLLVKDIEGVNEQASKFYIDEQTNVKAKKSCEDSPLLSRKSVERISPSKMDNEVLRLIFVICIFQCRNNFISILTLVVIILHMLMIGYRVFEK